LNENFYLSSKAPKFVLFNLKVMDEKLTPLEDAFVLRDLLIRYEPVATEGRYLLLQHRNLESPQLVLLKEGVVRPGESLDVQPYGDAALWLEFQLTPSLAGLVQQFIYQPPIVRLAARQADGTVIIRRRSPVSMLAAGFIASPLIVGQGDFAGLYSGQSGVHPASYSIELVKGEEFLWRKEAHFRLYKIENHLGQPAHNLKPSALFGDSGWWVGWRPPTLPQEILEYLLFLAIPGGLSIVTVLVFRRFKISGVRPGWGALLAGNVLLFGIFLTTLLAAGEAYFRFFYDTTDSMGYARVCERWVQRHWHKNRLGCRDNIEYSLALDPTKHRVSFVGDSFTAGHGIPDVEQRFPNRIRRAHPEWDVHVLADVGLDTQHEILLLKRAFDRGYGINDVVLVYCLNDVCDLLTKEVEETETAMARLKAQTPWFIQRSYMLDLFYKRYKASHIESVRNYFSFVKRGYEGAIWEQQKERLKEFRDLVQAHGGHLSVVTFPFMNALGPHYDYQDAHDKLNAFWRDLDVPHLDLLPLFQGYSSSQLTVNRYDAHPNERASQIAAEAIDRLLTAPKK
jgi:hypothetical protein